MKAFDIITGISMIVGAVNWGLVALFDLNLVTLLFGADTLATETVYVAVALSAIYHLVAAKAVANRFADHPGAASV